jgi:hypothetical protein
MSSAEVIDMHGSTQVIEGAPPQRSALTVEQIEEAAEHAGRSAIDAIQTVEQAAAQTASEAMDPAGHAASAAYRDAGARAREGYAWASETTQDFARLAWRSAQLMKQEYPLRALAVLAGAGFLAGILLRVRKGRRA